MGGNFLNLSMEDGRQLHGGSKDPRHVGWIEVLQFDFMYDNTIHSTPRPPSTLRITKLVDASSVDLSKSLVDGTYLTPAFLEVVIDWPAVPSWIFDFERVLVERISPGRVVSADQRAIEQIEFSFAKIGVSRGVRGAVVDATRAVVDMAMMTLRNVIGIKLP